MSDTKEPNKQEIIEMIKYINQKTPDVSLTDRNEILRIIMSSGVDDHKIQSKGGGTQIKYKDIPNNVIVLIYNFIKMKIDSKLEQLSHLTEEPLDTPE